MALTLSAGNNLMSVVVVKNTGRSAGTFVLTGEIRYKTGVHAGWLMKDNIDYCGKTMPADANQATIPIQPGAQATVTMFKRNWACGNSLAFQNNERFDIVLKLKCIESGKEIVRTYIDAIIHSQGTQPSTQPSTSTTATVQTASTGVTKVIYPDGTVKVTAPSGVVLYTGENNPPIEPPKVTSNFDVTVAYDYTNYDRAISEWKASASVGEVPQWHMCYDGVIRPGPGTVDEYDRVV